MEPERQSEFLARSPKDAFAQLEDGSLGETQRLPH
jgi:hypothetical protein